MAPEEFLEAIRREGTALVTAAERSLEAPVPSCPDWDVRQLVAHVGRGHRWTAAMVRTRSPERLALPPAPPSVDVAWFTSGVNELVAALTKAGPDARVWTHESQYGRAGPGPGTARFWFRRQAEETALHRWDTELAFGQPAPIDTELALAGIDELLDVLLARRRVSLGSSMHLHTTDSRHGEWTVRAAEDGDGLLVGHGHEKGDVALRGSAGDLLLWLWGRPVPPERLEVYGDPVVLAEWSTALVTG